MEQIKIGRLIDWLIDTRHCAATEVGGWRWCHLATAVLSAITSSQWDSSSPLDLQPTTVSPSGSSIPSSPSLKTASSTRVSASSERSTPNTNASFQTGLLVCRFVVVFFRFRLADAVSRPLLLAPPPLLLPMTTVTRTNGPTTNASTVAWNHLASSFKTSTIRLICRLSNSVYNRWFLF